MAKKKKGKGKKKQPVRIGKQRAIVVQVQPKSKKKSGSSRTSLSSFLLHPQNHRGNLMRGMYVEKGNVINVVELGNSIQVTAVDASTGSSYTFLKINDLIGATGPNYGYGLNLLATRIIQPGMFDHMEKFIPLTANQTGLTGLFDRMRIRRLRFVYVPAASTARDGDFTMWIDYHNPLTDGVAYTTAEGKKARDSASNVKDVIKSMQRQQHSVCVPLHRPAVLEWHPQAPSDRDWTSASDGSFPNNYYLNCAVTLADGTSTAFTGVIYANVLVDLTGAQ